jgi:hypothetical protein
VSIPDIDAALNVGSEPGVRVQIAQSQKDDLELVTRIQSVASAFEAEGIAAFPATTPDMENIPTTIQIRVGSKPK